MPEAKLLVFTTCETLFVPFGKEQTSSSKYLFGLVEASNAIWYPTRTCAVVQVLVTWELAFDFASDIAFFKFSKLVFKF